MTQGSLKVQLDYLGCKVNQAEIEELAQRFRQAGYRVTSTDNDSDIYVLNTCTITHVADRKARLLIHRMARRTPRPFIVVTGCYPSVDPAAVQAIEGVDLVVANSDKTRLAEIIEERLPLSCRPQHHLASGWPDSLNETVTFPTADNETGYPLSRTRAMLKVQDGCDHFCTYCIVPQARGDIRSVPIQTVVDEIHARVAQGYKEVVLTGVALGSYGRDAGHRQRSNALSLLVEMILHQTALPRLRLSSIEPENFDLRLVELWNDRRFCRHIHLPLQSGCDATLKRMGRRYRTTEYAALVERARAIAPDVAITTDIIVGFPGETSEHFAQSLAFAEMMDFAKIHVFRFSARHGTPATRLPDAVSEVEKKERAAEMIALSERSSKAFRRRFIGTQRDVLWEDHWRRKDDGDTQVGTWWTGLTDNYIRAYAASNQDMRNRITQVMLVADGTDGLIGTIA